PPSRQLGYFRLGRIQLCDGGDEPGQGHEQHVVQEEWQRLADRADPRGCGYGDRAALKEIDRNTRSTRGTRKISFFLVPLVLLVFLPYPYSFVTIVPGSTGYRINPKASLKILI